MNTHAETRIPQASRQLTTVSNLKTSRKELAIKRENPGKQIAALQAKLHEKPHQATAESASNNEYEKY